MRYKVIDSKNNIIAVDEDTNFNYVCYNAEDDIVVFCKNKKIAFGIQINNQIYSFGQKIKSYPIVSLIEIDILEYNYLKSLMEKSSDSTIEDTSEEITVIEDTSTINATKRKKIEEMSKECKSTISLGIDVTLSKGNQHFDLSTEDQLNINMLRYYLIAGEENIAYHSKNSLFEYYSREDIQKLIEQVDNYILYHTSYFNSLKNYINSLNKIETINKIQYGQDFPDEYKSEILLSF